MATFAQADGTFTGRSRYTLRVDVTWQQSDTANNRSLWRWSLQVINWDQSSITWDDARGAASVSVNGVFVYDAVPPVGTYDFRDGALSHQIATGTTWVPHNSDGNKTFGFTGGAANAGIFGNANASGSVAAPRIGTAPGAPGTPVVSSINTTNATFSWAAASNGGSAITDYGLYVSLVSNFASHAYQDWVGTGLSKTLPSGSFLPATKYYSRVRARNAIGTGPYSGVTSFITDPVTPSSVSIGTPSSSSLPVSWSRGSNGSALKDFQLQYSTSSTFSGATTVNLGNVTSYTITGLSRATRYYVRIRARNDADVYSGWSSTVAEITAPTVPDQMSAPTSAGVTTTSISWSWTAPNDGGSGIISYEHQVSRNSNFSDLVATFNDVTTPASRSGLSPNTLYYVRTRAINSVGSGAWSGGRSIRTSSTIPTAPTLAAGTVTSSAVAFTRGAPSSDGGSTITNYEFQLATNTSFTSGLQSWSSTSASQSRGGLTRATTYYIRARAVNANGTGPWSSTLTMKTSTTVPSAPPAATVTTRRTTSIVFSRGTSSDNGGASISTYEFQIARNTAFSTDLQTWSSGNSSQTASSLIPGTTYYIRYRARNSVGVSAWSPTTTTSTTASGVPALRVTAAARGTSADMVVTPPADVAAVATSYRVERRLLGSTATTTSNSASSSFTVTGLNPGSTYQWRASYFVGSFQSGFSAWQTVEQPLPNTSPGDYFDGSTAARGDLSFAWDGAVNNSTSRAIGVSVAGWGSISGTGTAIQRVTGGRSGRSAARLNILADATGWSFGQATHAAVAEGGIYFASIYVRPSTPHTMRPRLRWNRADGSYITDADAVPEVLVSNTTGWTRLTISGVAPEGAVNANVMVTTADLWLSGEYLDADDAMITVGALYPWFSGDTTDTATYLYDWMGTPNASVSRRANNPDLPPDPLLDPDCPPIPGAPQPPKIGDSCIEDVTSWRRWWAVIPESEVTEWLAVVPTLTIRTGDSEARQVRIRFYPNPEDVPPSGDTGLEIESEQAISYIPANTEFTIDGVQRRVFAEVGGNGIERPASHLLHGEGGGPATWPTLRCGIGYLISFDLPLEAAEVSLDVGVQLTTRMM